MNIIIKKAIFLICFVVINLVMWSVVLTSDSDEERQDKLYAKAQAKIDDEIYVTAVPLLEEAISIQTEKTKEIEDVTKDTYLKLIKQRGYKDKYIQLCKLQINRDNDVEVYKELANFYFENGDDEEALDLLNSGISATSSEELVQMFEDNRYSYTIERHVFDEITQGFYGTIGVKYNGNWGVALTSGEVIIPCIYEKVSTYEDGAVVVKKDGEIYTVDKNNNRIALLHESGVDFGELSQNKIAIQSNDKWLLANSNLETVQTEFEEIKTFKNGYAPAKQNNKWGLIDTSNEWLIQPTYDEIIVDELGRAYSQNAFFGKIGDEVKLIIDGVTVEGTFEDAKPFNNSSFAAVKNDGYWGFIDNTGTLVIDYIYDDADSFNEGLAPVKVRDMWGFISLEGEIVIEPTFWEAKGFNNGYAPVKIEDSWRMLGLNYFK